MLETLASELDQYKSDLATVMAIEMGKPITQGQHEIEKCVAVCRYYAAMSSDALAPTRVRLTDHTPAEIQYQPLGPILAIMPWNYPFWQVFRCLAPMIMIGNTVILKHAPNVSGCANQIIQLCHRAGLTDQVMCVDWDIPTIHKSIHHPKIRGVTLTGSTEAGKAVAKTAGEALKKCVLELGGSDAYIVCDDADLNHASACCVQSRLMNAGQSCIAAKRWVVHQSCLAEFTERVISRFRDYQLGDPRHAETNLGPLARVDLADRLHTQVQASIHQGAQCLMGGERVSVTDSGYLPTLLTQVKPGMPAYDEELFGPVGVIIAVQSDQEAITVANDTVYGLGGAVFTKSISRARAIIQQLVVGTCAINTINRSDPAVPFGGVKQSGFGRELSVQALHEFSNIKTIILPD